MTPLVRANKSGCLEQCEHGPTVAIYPQGIFYGGVSLKDVSRIIDETILGGRILADLLISDECLNNPDCEHIRSRTVEREKASAENSMS
jgi:(2Fe-2S) ferredoxin